MAEAVTVPAGSVTVVTVLLHIIGFQINLLQTIFPLIAFMQLSSTPSGYDC